MFTLIIPASNGADGSKDPDTIKNNCSPLQMQARNALSTPPSSGTTEASSIFATRQFVPVYANKSGTKSTKVAFPPLDA
jgi:hypothetical protein